MSKPSIVNITTTQTFQNWLDKTNEMVDLFRDSAVTASVTGDETTGDATLLGDFTANNVIAHDELRADLVVANSPGTTIAYNSPIEITGAAQALVATFKFAASGGRTRYTDGTAAWDIGMDNSTDLNFIMNSSTGTQFELSPNGVLTVPSIVTESDITIGTSITAANVSVTDTLTANNATITTLVGTNISGNFTGDIYHPAGNKIFENGGPAANVPATFTGNVNGTVSSLTNHDTDDLDEGDDNLYFTTTRAQDAITGGTGVTVAEGLVSIGQSVGTSANVGFNTVTAKGDITAFGTVSDITMKENINPIENALDKVSQLGGYTFNYLSNPDQEMTGVMAQEIQKVLPGIVYETIDPVTGKETFAVRHGNLVGLLIEAIKELSAKVGK